MEADQQPFEVQFFGFDPRKLCEDIYNCSDDIVSDGMDALEEALLASLPAPSAAASKHAKAQVIDSELIAEIKEGTDRMTEGIREAHEAAGDMFETYCLRNIFTIPDEFREEIRARYDADQLKPRRNFTAKQEDDLDEKIAFLEQELAKERNRGRALLRVHALYSKRLPEAEEADATMTQILNDFKSITGQPLDRVVPPFVEKAQRLKDLCDRLSSASSDTFPSAERTVSDSTTSALTSLARPAAAADESSNAIDAYKRDAPSVTSSAGIPAFQTLQQLQDRLARAVADKDI